ncbi:glycosyltransferase [Flaviaesturariibacter aridisoli]|uniref:Glycosyl transferase family 28 n=1 Tax=Flaviaesturariibacter aridisoli TaxID=2545761 RepID=A0A4R4DWW9_9BACT|nr:glycosyltransferase [Flaviaesturariibacter aridisoli]TCZ69068.1 glycosyl transferase family 28 [Flaviaesturariibacter aridisoli]
MIFVTVGSQLPFDRFIQAFDELAPELPASQEVIAQVFDMKYEPKHIKTLEYINPGNFKEYISNADLVVSHAGTGTIISVSQLNKPLIVFPRLGELRETRNNHQVDTCLMLEKTCGLQVAYNAAQLKEKIFDFLCGRLPVMEQIPAHASPELLHSLRSFINTGKNLAVGH